MTIASKALYWAHKVLRKVDLFPTSKFIRYNGQEDYTTATGGIVSIAVFIIFAVLFASMGLRTIDRQIIQSTVSVTNQVNPPTLEVQTSVESNFMFAISILGFDVTNTDYRLFNITLWQEFYGPGYTLLNSTQVPLSPCTLEHFSFGKDIEQIYHKFDLSKSFCPPINYKFEVGGKPVSNSSSFIIQVDKCDESVDPICVNNTVFSEIEQMVQEFTLIVPIINVQLNPGSADYKTYYLEDRNFFAFTSILGMGSNAALQQAVVNTDISIMPFEDIQTENFTVIPQLFTNIPYIKTPSKPFASVTFNKASTTSTYNRSFNKVDSYFSYVGGLIGTIIGLIFILQIYTQKAYELSISHKLFKDADGESINSASFNIFYFISMVFKKILNLCKCNINWPKTQKFIDCSEQMNFQLDITYVLKKIMFLQAAFQVLVKRQHFQALHLRDKFSITQAKQRRLKHFEAQIIKQENAPHNRSDSPIHNNQSNQFSEQNIIVKQNELAETKKNNSQILQKIDDFSALSVSPRSRINLDLKTNVIKVMKDSRRGDGISSKVLQKLDKRYCQKLKLRQEIQNPNQTVNPPIFFAGQLDSMDLGQNNEGKLKKQAVKVEDFDYDIQKQ